jgi:hypothetical protein
MASVLSCFRGSYRQHATKRDFMGTRENRQAQAWLVGSDKLNKRGRSEDLTEVRLPDSTSRPGELATWCSRRRKLNGSWET